MSLRSQAFSFALVGIAAAIAHYGALVALVELAGWRAVPATLVGYLAGGLLSYLLNRRLTFGSERPHGEAGWRFAVVAGVGFLLTYAAMRLLVERLQAPYLPAQLLTTGLVMVWSFLANRLWTFSSTA